MDGVGLTEDAGLRASPKGRREVRLPAGRWLADDGEVFTGPCRATVKTPLSRLPHFTRAE